jgi:hypothetical protein
MEKNVGKLDALIRYPLGGGLIGLAVVLLVWRRFIPAAIAIATGALGRCGLYKLFGINTCGVKKSK